MEAVERAAKQHVDAATYMKCMHIRVTETKSEGSIYRAAQSVF